jgi:tape measure domain-containing protein
MSVETDDRVVSLEFDNSRFEKNVGTSLSTLDKLKSKLNFTSLNEKLQSFQHTANNINLDPIVKELEKINQKYDVGFEIFRATISNLTNSVLNSAKKFVKALTIDPITTGFSEYETQINAVQTILANTSSKGTTIDDVTKALDELNHYADLTIYNFTEMTRNIGTFTAAGIDLDTSVSAIQGIANLAAVSGSTSQQASTAMYQLSQALATGTVKLMDWNSVVNAGMGGEVFQNALKETSALLGTGAEEAIESAGSFRESLSDGWLTAEVLTETLKKFTTSGANEYVATYTGLTLETVEAEVENANALYDETEAIDKASEALANKSGKNKDEIKSVLQMAQTATDAATKVKTFSQLVDVLKEAAQSGWAKTWQLLIGDYEEAKALITPLSDFLTNIINAMSDARNNLLESALGKTFSSAFSSTVNQLTKVSESVSAVTDAVTNLDEIASKVIRGDYGVGAERYNALTEAGYNYYAVQNKVNEALGDSFRYSDELANATQTVTKAVEETTSASEEATTVDKERLKTIVALNDEELDLQGYTDEQIKAIHDIRTQAKKLGLTTEEFIDQIDEINGKWLMVNSFKNIGNAFVTIAESMGKAWKEIFPTTLEQNAQALFNVFAGLNSVTATIKNYITENADELTRTFKGVFAALDIVTTLIGGPIKIAFKIIIKILSVFDLNLLDVTAAIGDFIVRIRDGLDNMIDWSAVTEFLIDKLKILINWTKKLAKIISGKFSKVWDIIYKTIKPVIITKITSKFKLLYKILKKISKIDLTNISFSDIISGIESAYNNVKDAGRRIALNIYDGLSAGTKSKLRSIADVAKSFANKFLTSIKDFLGIHSPSTELFKVGEYCAEGFINGISSKLKWLVSAVKTISNNIKAFFGKLDFAWFKDAFGSFISFLSNVEWAKLLSLIPLVVVITMVKKVYDFLDVLSNGIQGLNGVIDAFEKIEKGVSKVLKAQAFSLFTDGIVKIAEALFILAVSIWLISTIEEDDAYRAATILAILSIVLSLLVKTSLKLESAGVSLSRSGISLKGFKTGLIAIGIALVLMAETILLLKDMKFDDFLVNLGKMGLLILAIGVVLASMATISHFLPGTDFAMKNLSDTLVKVAIAMMLMMLSCKLAGTLSADELNKGIMFMVLYAQFIRTLVKSLTIGNNKQIAKVGGTLIAVSVAMGLMVGVCKIVSLLNTEDMIKGAAFALAYAGFVKILVWSVSMNRDKQIAKIGGMLLSISISMALMVGVCKLASMLDTNEMIAGGLFAAAMLVFIGILTKITTVADGTKTAKIMTTLIGFSVAVALMAAISILMGYVETEMLIKGVGAVTVLSLAMAAMAAAAKGMENEIGEIITVVVAMLAVVMALLLLNDYVKDGKKLLEIAGAVAMVMLAMGGTMAILSKIPAPTGCKALLKRIGSMIVLLAAMFVPMIAFAIVLAAMQDISNATENAVVIVGMMTTLSALAASLAAMKLTKEQILNATVAVLALSAFILPMMAVIYALKEMQGIENVAENAAALAVVIAAFGLIFTAMAKFIPNLKAVGYASVAMVAIAAIVTIFGALAAGVGQLLKKNPELEEFVDTGAPLLIKVAEAFGKVIGSFFGGIIGGFVGSTLTIIATSLVTIGATFKSFISKLVEASNAAEDINTDNFGAVKDVVDIMASIAKTDLLTTISSVFSGGGSVTDEFADSMKKLVEAVGDISEEAAKITINQDGIDNLVNAVKPLVELQSSIKPIGGVISAIKGWDDLGTFGVNAAGFIFAMKLALGALEDSSGNAWSYNKDSFNDILDASKRLIEVQGTISAIGGVMSIIKGWTDLGTFGSNVKSYMSYMKDAMATISDGTFKLDSAALNSVIDATGRLADLQDRIPTLGGFTSWFTGSNDLGTFGDKLEEFATAFTVLDDTTITSNQVKQIETFVNMVLDNFYEQEIDWTTIDNNIDNFSSVVAALGYAYDPNINHMDKVNVDDVSSLIDSSIKIMNMFMDFPWINPLLIAQLSYIEELGVHLKNFYKNVKSVNTDKIMAATDCLDALRNFLGNLSNTTITDADISALNASLGKLADISLSAFVQSFKDSNAELIVTGQNMITWLTDGMRDGVSSYTSNGSTWYTKLTSPFIRALRKAYEPFKSTGKYLMKGFADGIKSSTYTVKASVTNMATGVTKTANKLLEVRSPSRVFARIGQYVGQGFANGIESTTKIVDGTVEKMANSAVRSTNNAMLNLLSSIDEDVAAQPTITPVVDLTNVRSGAQSISDMFSDNAFTVGTRFNASMASAAMNRQIQNGEDSEVVSAIRQLGKELGNRTGDTYTINGVTYDDGSNITDAVRTLVRAARIERRV